MKSFAAVAAFVAAANAYAYLPINTTSVAPPVYETTTVSSTEIVCPGPTEIPIGGGSTITVSTSTTLTITDCPCTFTYPVVPTEVPEVPSTYVPGVPTSAVPAPPTYPTSNGTVPVAPAPYPTGTAAPTTGAPAPGPTEFPGAAGKAGLSLLAVAGALVAYL